MDHNLDSNEISTPDAEKKLKSNFLDSTNVLKKPVHDKSKKPLHEYDFDVKQAKRFIATLTGDENTKMTFCCFGEPDKSKKAQIFYGTLQEKSEVLRKLNQNGYAVYVTIQETFSKKRTRNDIGYVRALFVEIDDERDLNAIGLHLEPTMIIESSPKKYHIYWILNEPQQLIEDDGDKRNDAFKALEEPLIKYYSADTASKDIARVLRLPGFYHQKSDPFLSRIVNISNAKYSIENIAVEGQQLTIEQASIVEQVLVMEPKTKLEDIEIEDTSDQETSSGFKYSEQVDAYKQINHEKWTAFLPDLLHEKNKKLLAQEFPKNANKSLLLTNFVKDIYGILNYAQANDWKISGSTDDIINFAGNYLGIDQATIDRRVNSVKQADYLPTIVFNFYARTNLSQQEKEVRSALAMQRLYLTSCGKRDPLCLNYQSVEQSVFESAFRPKSSPYVFLGCWRKWDGRSFAIMDSTDKQNPDEEVLSYIFKTLGECYKISAKGDVATNFATEKNMKAAFNIAKIEIQQLKPLKENLDYVAFKNVTIHTATNKKYKHSKNLKVTQELSANLLPDIGYEHERLADFRKFLATSYKEYDPKLIQAMLRMYWDKAVPYEFFVNLVGDSGSGKGILSSVIRCPILDHRVSAIQSLSALEKPQDRYWVCMGKDLLLLSELHTGWNTADVINTISVNEPVSVRALFDRNGSSIKPYNRILINSTEKMKVATGTGIERRLLILETQPIPENERDSDLERKLTENIDYIVSWAFSIAASEAYTTLKEFNRSKQNKLSLREQAMINDPIQAFIHQCLEPTAHTSEIDISEAYEKYFRVFCERTGRRFPKVFSRSFYTAFRRSLPQFYVASNKKASPKLINIKLRDNIFNEINSLFNISNLYNGEDDVFAEFDLEEELKNKPTTDESKQEIDIDNEVDIAAKLIKFWVDNDRRGFINLCKQISNPSKQKSIAEIMKENDINIDFYNIENLELPEF